MRPIRNSKIFNYKETSEGPTITLPAGSVGVGFGFDFNLNDISAGQLAAFQALYDLYRIMAVKIQLMPQYTTYNANVATVDCPEIYFTFDPNSSDTPANAGVLFGYSTLRKRRLNYPFKAYLKPHARQSGIILSGGTANGHNVVPRSFWIDTVDAQVDYYGARAFITGNTTSTVAQTFRYIRTYYIQFKSTH